MSSFWGTPTWIFLHTFAEKINPTFYLNHRKEIIDIIKRICSNLPCPMCRQHADEYMLKVNENSVKNKKNLISMFIHFHNTVNLRTGKKKFDIKHYHTYKLYNIKHAYNDFRKTFGKKYTSIWNRNSKESLMEKNRIILCNHLFNWLKTYNNYFI
jgi:hypothetical protein